MIKEILEEATKDKKEKILYKVTKGEMIEDPGKIGEKISLRNTNLILNNMHLKSLKRNKLINLLTKRNKN